MPVVTHCQHPSTRHNTLPVPSPRHAPFEKTGLNPRERRRYVCLALISKSLFPPLVRKPTSHSSSPGLGSESARASLYDLFIQPWTCVAYVFP